MNESQQDEYNQHMEMTAYEKFQVEQKRNHGIIQRIRAKLEEEGSLYTKEELQAWKSSKEL